MIDSKDTKSNDLLLPWNPVLKCGDLSLDMDRTVWHYEMATDVNLTHLYWILYKKT